MRRIRTIARAVVNDIGRKMNAWQFSRYAKDLTIFLRVINQERNDKDKFCSFHDSKFQCISKGKEHKKYVFGDKMRSGRWGVT